MNFTLPNKFNFRSHGVYNFENIVGLFNWDIENETVTIDISKCTRANYQALSLLVLYIWHLNTSGCRINLKKLWEKIGATKMWFLMGAVGWFQVLNDEKTNFEGNKYKPLHAVRNKDDFKSALSKVESYAKDFDIEYEKTLRYVISELLYNTLEHGKNPKLPSIIQFSWYREHNELSFIVADLGVGIKKHLEQAYPPFEDHASAILYALKPKVSGTFAKSSPYKAKDNAGAGLYFSSNIIRRLHADMHIVSGNGVVHISPTDITKTTIEDRWPGTLVNVSIKLTVDDEVNLHRMMTEFRETAREELQDADNAESEKILYINLENYFGKYAEDKESAIKYRDKYILPAVAEDKNIHVDLTNIISAPHSFLNVLFSYPAQIYGLKVYKKLKIFNAPPEIRETIDFILEDNT